MKGITFFSFLLIFSHFVNGQCMEDVNFSYGDTQGAVPINVNFTNLSTGVAQSVEWYVNNSLKSTQENPTLTFDLYGYYNVCLIQTYSNCVDPISICQEVLVINSCSLPEDCQVLTNGDFEELDSPAPYGTSASSDNFNQDICGWVSTDITPYYCHYPDNTYVVFRVAQNMTEGIASSIESQMQIGEEYQLVFDYSIQLNDFGPTNPISPDKIEFILGPDVQSSAGQVIGELFSPSIDSPSKDGTYLLNNNYDCYPPSQFVAWNHYEGNKFIYTNEDNIYLKTKVFANSNPSGEPVIFLDNVEIIHVDCESCDAQPNFSWLESACNEFTFAGSNLNPNAPGFISWSIDGITLPQFTGSSTIEDYNFPFTGDHEVCMNITCPNGITIQHCEMISTSSIVNSVACESPCWGATSIDVEGQRCGDNSNEIVVENFAITVPKGYGPCGTNIFFTDTYNGVTSLNDYYIDDTDPANDVINISFTIIVNDINAQIGTNFAVCSPDGLSSMCIRLNVVEVNTCDVCSDDPALVANLVVNCMDTDLTDNVFMYQGSFVFDPPFPNATQCGVTSSNSGTAGIIGASTDGEDTFPVSFGISTNSEGTFNTNVTLCFYDASEDKTYCYNVDINVSNPCMPDPDGCEIDIPPYTIVCDEVRDDNAVFVFSYALHLPEYIEDKYDYCTIDAITGRHLVTSSPTIELEPGVIIQPTPTIGVNAYIFAVEIAVPCDDLALDPSTELIISLCDENGNEVCVDIDLNLECDACDGNKARSPSADISKDYSVFPNPANNIFNIVAPKSDMQQNFAILSPTGKIIIEGLLLEGQNIVNLADANAGLYLILLQNGDQIEMKKILIIK